MKKYIRHLTKPLNQGDIVAPPLLNSSQEVAKDFEEEMVMAKETKEWMVGKNEEVTTFMERLTLAYGPTSSLLSRLVVIVESWDNL